jgi:hypothetical protein
MNRTAVALLVLGSLQMAGDLLDRAGLGAVGRPLKGVGAASTASPAPKVFSAVRGLETYSTRFTLEWNDRSGREHSLLLTPELYGQVRGPYNRRNVYGAALAYGPVLTTDERTAPLFRAVAGHALTGEAPLLRELGIDPAGVAGPVRVCYEPRPGTDTGDLPLLLEIRSTKSEIRNKAVGAAFVSDFGFRISDFPKGVSGP